jgi:HD domain/GAF domain
MERVGANDEVGPDPDTTLAALGQRALGRVTIDNLMRESLSRIREVLGADAVHVVQWRPDTEEFSLMAGEGWNDDRALPLTVDEGPRSQSKYALDSAVPLIVDDLAKDGRFDLPSSVADHNVRSSVHVLIGSVDERWGVLGIYSHSPGRFTSRDAQFALAVANILAGVVRHQRLRNQFEQRLDQQRGAVLDALQAIAVALESRDPYTAGHQRRVAKLAMAIAEMLGLDADRLQGVWVAGIIHNIGKVFLPWDILAREGPLSAVEFGLVKTHPQLGHDILQKMDFPWPLADIVLQHHERLDGSGYPSGLQGDEILLEARIITVADVVEAMVSDRRYRPGRDLSTALEEVAENRGRYYDPRVVDACLTLFNERSFSFD